MSPRQTAIIGYTQRFRETLGMLCSQTPPHELCVAWLESDDERLQEWVLEHMKSNWATGIGTIDAARFMADNDQAEEGRKELVSYGVERVLRHLLLEPISVRRLRGRWGAVPCPPGLQQDSIRHAIDEGLVLVSDPGKGKATLRMSPQYSLA